MNLSLFMKDGQSCGNVVDVQQLGDKHINVNSQIVIPRSILSCYGRLTGYLISLNKDNTGHIYPHIQIWCPNLYQNKIEQPLSE